MEDKMKLYLVFENTIGTYDFKEDKYLAVECEFCGAFDLLDKAVERCKGEMYWIGAINLNEPLPDERVQWPEYYDHQGNKWKR